MYHYTPEYHLDSLRWIVGMADTHILRHTAVRHGYRHTFRPAALQDGASVARPFRQRRDSTFLMALTELQCLGRTK